MHPPLRGLWIVLVSVVVLISPVLSAIRAAAANGVADLVAEMDRRTNYWQRQLPFCNWPGFAPYPSKFEDVLPDPRRPIERTVQ